MAIHFVDTEILENGAAYPVEKILLANTLEILAALTGMGDGEVRLVPGYGFYRYDIDGVLAADGTIVVASATGQWVNDTWYGIVYNG